MTDTQVHWTENWVKETVDENGKSSFSFYNKDSELIDSRPNKLMAQVALMDYCTTNASTYVENPVNYLISLHKLISNYEKRLTDINKTQNVITPLPSTKS